MADRVETRRMKNETESTETSTSATTAIILVATGAFAVAVFDDNRNDSKNNNVLFKQGTRRYATRRCGGGAQRSSRATSVGGRIRAYHAKMAVALLKEAISNQLVASASRLVYSCAGRHRHSLFSVLSHNDPRLVRCPIQVAKPCHSEILRVYAHITNNNVALADHDDDGYSSVDSCSTGSNSSGSDSDSATTTEISPLLLSIIAACHDPSLELEPLLKLHTPNSTLPSPYNTTTLLHLAVRASNHAAISLLLQHGHDPAMKDARGRLAYDLCTSSKCRDAFRFHRHAYPLAFDYDRAAIGPPLDPVIAAAQSEAQAARKAASTAKRTAEKNAQRADAAANLAQAAADAAKEAHERNMNAKNKSKSKNKSSTSSGHTLKPTSSSSIIPNLNALSIGISPEQRARIDREKRALAAEARANAAANKCGSCAKSLAGITPFEKQAFKYCSMACLKKHQILF